MTGVVLGGMIAIFYSVAMGVDAISEKLIIKTLMDICKIFRILI